MSGTYDDVTLGTPIGMVVRNKDQKSKDYDDMAAKYRPFMPTLPTTPSMEFARLQEVVDLLQERQLGVLQLELLPKRY